MVIMRFISLNYHGYKNFLDRKILGKDTPQDDKYVIKLGTKRFFSAQNLNLEYSGLNFKIIDDQIVETEEYDGRFLVVFQILPEGAFCNYSKRYEDKVSVKILEQRGCEVLEIVSKVTYDYIFEKDIFNIFIIAIFEKQTSYLKIGTRIKHPFPFSLIEKTDYEVRDLTII